jgi:hypothetical protein
MADQTIKDQILEAMQKLPPNATFDDAMERLYVLSKIHRAMERSERGETMSHEEAVRRLRG